MATLPLQATAFLILFARVGAMLMLLPLFSEEAIPMRLRLLAALGFTLGLWALLGEQVTPAAAAPASLPAIVIAELLVGFALGSIVRIMFYAAAMAGSIISLQIGLSSAIVFDPTQGGSAALLSKFVNVAAVIACLAIGVHHLWIASLVKSYALFPVGALPPAGDFAVAALRATTRAMSLGIGLAAPLIVFGILFNVALGLAARMAPAIQIFFLAQPLNILLGLALLSTVIGAILTVFAGAMTDWMQSGWS